MKDSCFCIVFGLDDNYAKYASVSMTSIIYSIAPSHCAKLLGGGAARLYGKLSPTYPPLHTSCLYHAIFTRELRI
ncbi:hypothetical protein [Helicobacter canis]|uniref:hypothetical protein n=1 Tax=Helicobacter canis TaxID=29419 RepID=UPI00155A2AEF|nr:hypothetical protein [Helicobacter canis]